MVVMVVISVFILFFLYLVCFMSLVLFLMNCWGGFNIFRSDLDVVVEVSDFCMKGVLYIVRNF